jgi:hypothetical protein
MLIYANVCVLFVLFEKRVKTQCQTRPVTL